MKLRTGDPSGSLARMLQTLADWLSAPRCMCCVIDHHEVRSAPIAVRMQRKGWFGNRVKELIQILNRPRAIAGLLTELEDRLGIVIEDDEVDGEMLESFGSLVTFAQGKALK